MASLIGRPRVHVICGFCGDNTSWKFSLNEHWDEFPDDPQYKVGLTCGNCSVFTSLDEIMDEENEDD